MAAELWRGFQITIAQTILREFAVLGVEGERGVQKKVLKAREGQETSESYDWEGVEPVERRRQPLTETKEISRLLAKAAALKDLKSKGCYFGAHGQCTHIRPNDNQRELPVPRVSERFLTVSNKGKCFVNVPIPVLFILSRFPVILNHLVLIVKTR